MTRSASALRGFASAVTSSCSATLGSASTVHGSVSALQGLRSIERVIGVGGLDVEGER